MTEYFVLAAHRGLGGLRASLTHAYQAAGLQVPFSADAFDALLSREATAPDVQQALARELLQSGVDPAKCLDRALRQLQRAMLADHLRQRAEVMYARAVEERRPEFVRQALSDIEPAFDAAATQVRDGASRLPGLRVESAIAAGLSAELGEVFQALAAMGSMICFLPPQVSGVGPAGRHLVAVVETEHVDAARVVVRGGEPLNPNPIRDGIRQYVDDARDSADAAIVGAARGDYPGVRLRLVTSVHELSTRESLLRTACTDTFDERQR